jgi:hypothetical protein
MRPKKITSGQFMLLHNQVYYVLLALLGLCVIERCGGMGIWLVWDRDDMHTDFWWGNFLVNAHLEDRVDNYQEEDENAYGFLVGKLLDKCPLGRPSGQLPRGR